MTAPTRTRTQSPSRTARRRATSPEEPVVPPSGEPTRVPRRRPSAAEKARPTAAERAYARRAQRAELAQRRPEGEGRPRQDGPIRLRLRLPRSRASFVLLVMGLLAAGVAATLWLSTQAIADSYRLEEISQENARLAERAEQLQRYVTDKESASSLAEAASRLGMVPGGDPARVVVRRDGTTTVVGEPKEATAPKPPPQTPPDEDTPAQQTDQPGTENGQAETGQAEAGQDNGGGSAGDRSGGPAGEQDRADDPGQLAAGEREAEQRTVPAAGGR